MKKEAVQPEISDANPCLDCGTCCQNMWFLDMPLNNLNALKNPGTQVYALTNNEENLKDPGLYVSKNTFNQNYLVYISGKCPKLQPDNKCQIYTDPNRPQHCADFKMGSEVCNDYRKEVKLPKINEDGTAVPKVNRFGALIRVIPLLQSAK